MTDRRLVVDTSTFINLARSNNLDALTLSGRTIWIPDVVRLELNQRIANTTNSQELTAATAARDWIVQNSTGKRDGKRDTHQLWRLR